MCTDEATAALQNCFKGTDWQMFRDAATLGNHINLEEYISSVTSFISKCVDDVMITKTIKHFPTRKCGWMARWGHYGEPKKAAIIVPVPKMSSVFSLSNQNLFPLKPSSLSVSLQSFLVKIISLFPVMNYRFVQGVSSRPLLTGRGSRPPAKNICQHLGSIIEKRSLTFCVLIYNTWRRFLMSDDNVLCLTPL